MLHGSNKWDLKIIHIMNQRSVLLAADNSLERTFFGEGEDDNRQVIILAKRKCSAVHDFQSHIERPHITEFFELLGFGIMHGVIVIDAVHFGSLKQYLSVEFNSTEGCRSVGCEKRVPASRRKNSHSSRFQVTNRPPANKRFSHRWHLDSGLHTRDHTQFFYVVLK